LTQLGPTFKINQSFEKKDQEKAKQNETDNLPKSSPLGKYVIKPQIKVFRCKQPRFFPNNPEREGNHFKKKDKLRDTIEN
jgi:hypothetical protein